MDRIRRQLSHWLWAFLALGAAAAIVIGVQRGEWEVVQRWAQTLCTSCIGLGK